MVVKGGGVFEKPDEDSLSPLGGQVSPGQRAEGGRVVWSVHLPLKEVKLRDPRFPGVRWPGEKGVVRVGGRRPDI